MKLLNGEVRHLRQLVHLQQAQLRAIQIYGVAKIADLSHEDRTAAFAHLGKIVRELYDEQISELEAKFPAIASDIDVRGTMPEHEQELWYLLEKYYPKKGEPPIG
jgi:hypothetical protein